MLTTAQTDFRPYLWRIAGDATTSPALQKFARDLLEKLVPGADAEQDCDGVAEDLADQAVAQVPEVARPGPLDGQC